jgi:hypothetical protein
MNEETERNLRITMEIIHLRRLIADLVDWINEHGDHNCFDQDLLKRAYQAGEWRD